MLDNLRAIGADKLAALDVEEWFESYKRRITFNRKEQAALLLAFAKPMSIGRQPVAIAEHMAKYGQKLQKVIALDILECLRQGDPMTDALDKWIDPVSMSALRAAEAGGADTFADSLEYIANNLEIQQKGITSIVAKWLYPAGFVAGTTVAILFMNKGIVPVFQTMSDGPNPGIERFVSVANFYTFWFPPLVILLGLSLVYFQYWLRNNVGEAREKFDAINLFSGYRLNVGANIISTFALLKRFGLSGYEALQMMATYGSPYQQYHIYQMRRALKEGSDNEIDALDTGLLDDEYISLLKLYAETDSKHVVAAMTAASQDIRDRVLDRTRMLGNIVYYVLWLWLGFNLITIITLMFGVKT